MHDAIGFHNLDTGLNYTLEWYELVELFNCTFAHVLKNDSVIWCNQGAACIYDGLDKKHWQQNGTFVKVAEITGRVICEVLKTFSLNIYGHIIVCPGAILKNRPVSQL